MSDHEPRMTGTKTCTHRDCIHRGKPLPVIHFSVRRAALDGLADWCRDCEREANKHSPKQTQRRKQAAIKKVYRARLTHFTRSEEQH